MACGTPVIATDVGGVSQIVTAPEAGIILRERSADAVATGVRRFLACLPERAATRRYAEQFGWSATTRAQIELFRQLLDVGNALPAVPAARVT
jgi:glycosyltransferase involved in cell wall biosynthesis